MFGTGMGGGQQPTPQRRAEPQAQNPWGDNPLGKIFEEMMKGAQATARPEPTPEPTRRQAPPQDRAKNPYDDIFGKMFETGAKQRDEYEKNMGSIFDQFSKGMDRYR